MKANKTGRRTKEWAGRQSCEREANEGQNLVPPRAPPTRQSSRYYLSGLAPYRLVDNESKAPPHGCVFAAGLTSGTRQSSNS